MTRAKTIVLDTVPHGTTLYSAEKNLEELLSLVQTAGGIVVEKIIQKRGRPSAKTFLGSGKIREAAEFCKENHIELVIINGSLKPHQYINLGKLFPKDIKIWDRIDLILKIFDRHAHSPEAKMQIQLARLHHEIPKIYARESTTLFERAGAGIGTRGAGEKGINEEKRHIRRQIKNTERKLEEFKKKQASQRKARKKTGMPIVALVGYTNAGKSSLMKLLSKKERIEINDALFVTLETKIGKVWLPDSGKSFLLADTIGFIRELPPELISSFETTLQEAKEADLLLHVVDISDPEYEKKIAVVHSILEEIGCNTIPQLFVFNKTDTAFGYSESQKQKACFLPEKKFKNHRPTLTSVVNKTGTKELLSKIDQALFTASPE
jgi:GTP-binding protein HflX